MLQYKHSSPFSIDFPSQFNAILMFYIFLFEIKIKTTTTQSIYIGSIVHLTKECINLAFLVGAVDYEHRVPFDSTCYLFTNRGSVGEYIDPWYHTHTYNMKFKQLLLLIFCFHSLPFFILFFLRYLLSCVCFALC